MKTYIEKWAFEIIEAGIRYGYPFFLIVRLFGFKLTTTSTSRVWTIIPLGFIMIAVLVFFFFQNTIKTKINRMPSGALRSVFATLYGCIPYAVILIVGIFIYNKIPIIYGSVEETLKSAYLQAITFMNDFAYVCVWLFICYVFSRVWELIIIVPLENEIRRNTLRKDLDAIGKGGKE